MKTKKTKMRVFIQHGSGNIDEMKLADGSVLKVVLSDEAGVDIELFEDTPGRLVLRTVRRMAVYPLGLNAVEVRTIAK